MIKCTNAACGAENEDGAKFCEHCGTQLPQYKECPSCHSKAKLTARFCAECGCKLSEQSNISQQSDKKNKSESEISDSELAALNAALTESVKFMDDNEDDSEDESNKAYPPFDVYLDGYSPDKKLELVKEMRLVFGIGNSEAMRYMAAAPVCLLRDVSKSNHSEEIERLKNAGAEIRLEKGRDSFGKNMSNTPLQIEPLPEEKTEANPQTEAKPKTEAVTAPQTASTPEKKSKKSEKDQVQKNIDNLLKEIIKTSAISYPVRIKGKLDAEKLQLAFDEMDCELNKKSVLLHIDITPFGKNNKREWMIVTDQNIFSKSKNDDNVKRTAIFSANFEISSESELMVNGENLIPIAKLGLETLKLIKTLLDVLKEIANGSSDPEGSAEVISKTLDLEKQVDKIDFMAELAKINDNAIYVLPTVNNRKRWDEKRNNLGSWFNISDLVLSEKAIIAYMEEKGLLFGISNSVAITPGAICTKKGVKIEITPNTTAKFVVNQHAKNFKDLIVNGVEVCSFFDVSTSGMEQFVRAIEAIVRAKNAPAKLLLMLAERYLAAYSHYSFYLANNMAFWAVSKGCEEAIPFIRKIALLENSPLSFSQMYGYNLKKFNAEIKFIHTLVEIKHYRVTERIPDTDDKAYEEHKKNVVGCTRELYESFQKGNAEAAYYIAKILEQGWGSESDIFAVIRQEKTPEQESFVYWYKKSAEGGFQGAIEQMKKIEEWEKEIAEKPREELSPEAALFADKKQGILFDDNGKWLLKYPADLPATNYSVPKCVERIAAKAFYKCENLTSVTLPDTVTFIGSYSFANMPSLTEIKLSENLDIIKDNAFWKCEKLAKIDLPANLRIIGSHALKWCESLTEVTIPDRIEEIPSSMFMCCKKLEKIVIGEKVVDIKESAFNNCENLKVIVWGKSLKHIERNAFEGCTSFTHFALPSTAYTPAYHVFDDCKNLTSVLFPDGTGSEHEQLVPSGCAAYVAPRSKGYEQTAQLYHEAYAGKAESQCKFAAMLISGNGLKQNMREAVKWFTKAANQGYAEAQYELGVCFRDGMGVTQDAAAAIKWFALAGSQGHEKAKQAEEAVKNPQTASSTAGADKSQKVNLILDSCGAQYDEVCKNLCQLFQADLETAKAYADAVPVYLCEEIAFSDAEYIKQKLEANGASLRIEICK